MLDNGLLNLKVSNSLTSTLNSRCSCYEVVCHKLPLYTLQPLEFLCQLLLLPHQLCLSSIHYRLAQSELGIRTLCQSYYA